MTSETGKKIERLMNEHGFTQASIAKAIGVSQGTIWKIISGESKRSKYMPEIARLLGVDATELQSSPSPKSKSKHQAIFSKIEEELIGLDEESLKRVLRYSSNLRENKALELEAKIK